MQSNMHSKARADQKKTEDRMKLFETALPPGYRLAEYILEKPLASGGFSIVYLARDDQGNKFAIKEYFPNEVVKRNPKQHVVLIDRKLKDNFDIGMRFFFEEARILMGINHPNVVRTTNFFRANSTLYMVMEYVVGKILDKVIKDLNPPQLPEPMIREIFSDIASGLAVLHDKGIVHLDLKPGNIFVRNKAGAMLIDFGASRFIENDAPVIASMYTPGYSAPEQHDSNGKIGACTDIYNFGATLHVVLGAGLPMSSVARMQLANIPDWTIDNSAAFEGSSEDGFLVGKMDIYDHLVARVGHRYSRELIDIIADCMFLFADKRPTSMQVIHDRLLGPYTAPMPIRSAKQPSLFPSKSARSVAMDEIETTKPGFWSRLFQSK
jgi:serine/threonine protein kinase